MIDMPLTPLTSRAWWHNASSTLDSAGLSCSSGPHGGAMCLTVGVHHAVTRPFSPTAEHGKTVGRDSQYLGVYYCHTAESGPVAGRVLRHAACHAWGWRASRCGYVPDWRAAGKPHWRGRHPALGTTATAALGRGRFRLPR